MAWIQAGFEEPGGIEARIGARRPAPLLVMPGPAPGSSPGVIRGVPGIHVLRHRGVSPERTSRWRDVGTRNTPGLDPGAGTTEEGWRP